MSDKVGKIWNEAVEDWYHSRWFTGWAWINSRQEKNEHMWLVLNSTTRSPCYLQSLTRLPALPHYLQQVPTKHLLPHATYIGYQPSTNTTNRVRKLSEIACDSWCEWAMTCRGEKILGRWARKNLHPFSCLGMLISLLHKHCTIYTTETWHLWSKNVTCKRKTL